MPSSNQLPFNVPSAPALEPGSTAILPSVMRAAVVVLRYYAVRQMTYAWTVQVPAVAWRTCAFTVQVLLANAREDVMSV